MNRDFNMDFESFQNTLAHQTFIEGYDPRAQPVSSAMAMDQPWQNQNVGGFAPACASNDRVLPIDFAPSPHSVILGRGKHCKDASGNRRLKVLISMNAERYVKAEKKEEKTQIVTYVYRMVRDACRDACSDSRAAFVRLKGGRWHVADFHEAREKISGLFRDELHAHYRSSNKSKMTSRRERRFSSISAAMRDEKFVLDESLWNGDASGLSDSDKGESSKPNTVQARSA